MTLPSLNSRNCEKDFLKQWFFSFHFLCVTVGSHGFPLGRFWVIEMETQRQEGNIQL